MTDYRIELIEILKGKLTEGLEQLKDVKVTDKNYGDSIVNVINTDKTIKQLQSELDFDKTRELIKNDDVTVADLNEESEEN